MNDIAVLQDASTAIAALDPARNRLLSQLLEPASAAMLAGRLEMPRQKVHYHLKTLESHGLVEPVETRKWGGLTERLYVASASSYVVSPDALGSIAPEPSRWSDRLSAAYLVALAGRVVREVGGMLRRRANDAGKPFPSLSIDTEIRFRSPSERAAFTQDLTESVNRLVARYHDAAASGGRPHRMIVVAYPTPQESKELES